MRAAVTPLRALTVEMLEDADFLLGIVSCFRDMEENTIPAEAQAEQLKRFVAECSALQDYIEEFITTRVRAQAEQSFLGRLKEREGMK
jgi:hypothetical protein